MKNTDIAKIRQKLEFALAAYKNGFWHTSGNYISQALALLPCETCDGTKEVRGGFCRSACNDCQKPKRKCKNNKACTRYMDGTCEDCPDYK